MRALVFLSVALLFALAGCGDDDGAPDGGPAIDGGGRDAGSMRDAGNDGGAPDGGAADGGAADGGVTEDGGPFDGGSDASVGDAGPPARARLVYLSVGGVGSRLAVVELGADGTLTAMTDMDLVLPQNPGAMVYARSARRLYSRLGGTSIATIALDDSGTPSLLGRTDGTGNPIYLSLTPDEETLVSAYYFGADDTLRTHDVSGAPPHALLDTLPTSNDPQAALVGPTGTRVYVPHRSTNVTRWFDLASDGSLAFAAELDAEPNAGPRHIVFSPSGAYAYVVNEYGDSVAAHRVASDGSLERFQSISTLPEGVDGASNAAADVHVTSDGRFLYVSNRGHDSLAMYAVGTDGTLGFLGTVPTEERPREFDVSPDGRFVVAAGQDSGMIQSYRVEADGRLTSVDRLSVGPALLWVIID